MYGNEEAIAGKKYNRIVIFQSGSIRLMLKSNTKAINTAAHMTSTISASKKLMQNAHGIV